MKRTLKNKKTSKNKKIKRTLKKSIRGGSASSAHNSKKLKPLERPLKKSPTKSSSPSLKKDQVIAVPSRRTVNSRRRSANLRRTDCMSDNKMKKDMIDLPTNNIDIFATLKLDSESLLDNLINSGHIDNSHSARKVAESLISPAQTSFRDMGYITTMGSASKLYNTGRSVMPVLEPLGAALVASALIFNVANVWNKSINESTNNFINCKINLSLNINRSNKCGNLIAKETLLAAWSNLERIMNVKIKNGCLYDNTVKKFYTSSLSIDTALRGSSFSINESEKMRPYLPGGTWGHKGFKLQHVLTKEDWDDAFAKAEQLDKEQTPEIIKELHNQSYFWTKNIASRKNRQKAAAKEKEAAALGLLGLGYNLNNKQLKTIQEGGNNQEDNTQYGGSASRIINKTTAADRAMSMWLGDNCDSNFKTIWLNKLDKSPVFLCPNAVTGFCPKNIGFILLKKINKLETSDNRMLNGQTYELRSDPLMKEFLSYKPVSFKEFILNPYEKYRLGVPIVKNGYNIFEKSQEAMRNDENLNKTLNAINDYIPLDIFESPLLIETSQGNKD